MGGLMGGSPKTPQSVIDAEKRAKDAEAKAAADEAQSKADAEIRRQKQRGKASTILTQPDTSSTGRSLLGG